MESEAWNQKHGIRTVVTLRVKLAFLSLFALNIGCAADRDIARDSKSNLEAHSILQFQHDNRSSGQLLAEENGWLAEQAVPVDRPFSSAAPLTEFHSYNPDLLLEAKANLEAMVTTNDPDYQQGEGQVTGKSTENVLGMKISVSALQLPVTEILMGIADQAELELFIGADLNDGSAAGTATLNARDRKLEDILNLLAVQSGLAWELKHSVLNVFPDRPIVRTYDVDYLNISRSTQSSVGLATQVGSINLSLEGAAGGSGHSNNSRTLIENNATHDFWLQLKADLQKLLRLEAEEHSDIIVNREAGLVTARCHFAQHLEVMRYLKTVQRSVDRQVLIEATVVEVKLSDRHKAGVDWRLLGDGSEGSSGDGVLWSQNLHGQNIPQTTDSGGALQSLPSALLSFVQRSSRFGNISATIDLLHEFGDVRILSQPMIMAMNNQSAVLKIVDNRVYFSVNVERQNQGDSDREEINTQTRIHTVPVGLVMNVMPFISSSDRVVLNIRPTISRILGFVNDPNPELGLTSIQNGVPEIQVREMESVLSLQSGQVAVIGGLMQESGSTSTSGVPGLGELPLLGSLFRKKQKLKGKTELLVFLRPTIVRAPEKEPAHERLNTLGDPGLEPMMMPRSQS